MRAGPFPSAFCSGTSVGNIRRLHSDRAARPGEQCVCPDWHDRAHRVGGQERDPDRGICQRGDTNRGAPLRIAPWGRPAAPPADPDDLLCLSARALPLAISTGAGAVARQIMGTAVLGGTMAASFIAVFPHSGAFYVVVRFFRKRGRVRIKRDPGAQNGGGRDT